jgi:class 3 adenylate cyclase
MGVIDLRGNQEVVYLVYTDVKESTGLDKKHNPIEWRKKAFCKQLTNLLNISGSLALKSIGDALFVIFDKINHKENEELFVKELLHSVWKATQEITIDDSNINIRAVVHRITGHERGRDISAELKAINTIGDKSSFENILELDIFGNEVNKAARILSLTHGSCILVSESIANIINNNAIDSAIKGNSIDFSYNGSNFILNSPVPVLYMKGVYDIEELADHSPYLVWELNIANKERHCFASEFKSIQALRLILVRLINALNINDQKEKIIKETLLNLSLDNPSFTKRFYVDICWKVVDFFLFHDAVFDRIDKSLDPKNYYSSLKKVIKKGVPSKNKISINGQAGRMKIIAVPNSINKLIYSPGNVIDDSNIVALLLFTSCLDNNHSYRIRNLLSNSSSKKLCVSIEPQSIELFKNVIFNDPYIDYFLDKDPGDTTMHAFSKKTCLLIVFQIYSAYQKQSNNPNELFNGVAEIDDGLNVAFYGLTTGLTDGFVLYTCNTDWKAGLLSILKKLICPIENSNFYMKVYPLSIFILEEYSDFVPLKQNIKYLKDINNL